MRSARWGLSRPQILRLPLQSTLALDRPAKPFAKSQTHVKWLSACNTCRQTHFANNFFPHSGLHDASAEEAPEETSIEILARARAYNIHTFAQLDYESSVGHRRHGYLPRRLVDKPSYNEDFYLWTILLDWQRLRNGHRGVRWIWEGMKTRHRCKSLPFTGYQGDKLWPALVAAGIGSPGFLKEIVYFELRNGHQRPRFFLEVVGELLKSGDQILSLNYARLLQVAHRPDKLELFDLLVVASKCENSVALQTFCKIYSTMPPLGIYGRVIAYFFLQKRATEAWMMHRFLISRGDLPQTFPELQPLVQDLVDNRAMLEPLLRELENAGISMATQVRTFYDQKKSLMLGFSSENLNIVMSNTLGVRPRALSDAFVARAISTATFSFKSIVAGLRLVGLRMIGPMSMRAMGLTSANSQELLAKFDVLVENEIDIGSSRFVRLVKRLARQGNERILQSVLQSDQHADVFEDITLQRRLLRSYFFQEDWPAVGRTLAVLTIDSDQGHVRRDATAFKLQAALSAEKWGQVRKIMAEMLTDGRTFTSATVALMHSKLLPARRPGAIPATDPKFDGLGILVSLWLDVLKSGSSISVGRWNEPIRRLGMYGRIAEIEFLLPRLVSWYGAYQVQDRSGRKPGRPNAVGQLLSAELQSAIVAWGFIHGWRDRPHAEDGTFIDATREPSWTWGVQLLRNLKDKFDCDIDVNGMRRTCVQRLRQLFDPESRSILRRNRLAASHNRSELDYYVECLENAWKGPLFPNRQVLSELMKPKVWLSPRQARRIARTWPWRVNHANHGIASGSEPLETKTETMPAEVVLPGGPLSQAYWSLDRNK